MGLLKEDIEALKKGKSAGLVITHISSPDASIELDLSLNGFTAAFDIIKSF